MVFVIILALIGAMGLIFFAQWLVKRRFKVYSLVDNTKGITGAEVARQLLDENYCKHILIEVIPGQLSDHYDPIAKVIRLSEDVYYGSSIASISVAAHEVGHAIQDRQNHSLLRLRHRIVPAVNISANIAPFLLLAGVLLKVSGLTLIGIIFFSAAVFFQLITLPVEFDASAKARRLMILNNWITRDEETGVKKVLNAAALTYVAATLYSFIELINFVHIFLSQNEED